MGAPFGQKSRYDTRQMAMKVCRYVRSLPPASRLRVTRLVSD